MFAFMRFDESEPGASTTDAFYMLKIIYLFLNSWSTHVFDCKFRCDRHGQN